MESGTFETLLRALHSGKPADFETIAGGSGRRLVNPQAGCAFCLEGGDPRSEILARPRPAGRPELLDRTTGTRRPVASQGNSCRVLRRCCSSIRPRQRLYSVDLQSERFSSFSHDESASRRSLSSFGAEHGQNISLADDGRLHDDGIVSVANRRDW